MSADNRYRLFVNGEEVSSGPQRSDLMHWRYETVDVGPHLRAGRNVIAALVWNWGPDKPVAQFSRQTAFLLQGNSPREAVVNSGSEWRVLRNEGYAPIPVLGDAVGGYYAAPPGEAIDARRNPWGWTQTDFTDDGWIAAAAGRGPRANRTQLRASNPFGEAGGWQLMPRSIPPMEQTPVRFATVRRSEGIAPDTGFLRGTSDFVVPAKTRTVILLDQGHLTNAFAVLETSGGAELGVPTFAEHYRSLAQKVRDEGVRTASWDPPRRLFRDRPDGTTYSQQANVMAVLTDAVAPAGQAGLMERVLSDTTLTQSTYYFSYYQLEALRKAGLGDRYVEQLAPWRGMLALGLTTVPETPEPTRSDSHAWSAHPNYGLYATVLGVRPAEPGFKSVRIAPNLGPLRRVEGRVPHPRGEIVVRLDSRRRRPSRRGHTA